MLQINETFKSVQGESTHAGKVCFFIRLAGCNLKCAYCDTQYACDTAAHGEPRSIVSLVQEAIDAECHTVEITGGEPLLQEKTPVLAEKLLTLGKTVLIETNGSLDFSVLPPGCCRIVDCKLPGSGMEAFNRYDCYKHLTPEDEVKFVVSSRSDFDFACDVIRNYSLEARTGHLLFSPVWGKVSFEELAEWLVKCGLDVRMQLQLHKLIWGDKRGV